MNQMRKVRLSAAEIEQGAVGPESGGYMGSGGVFGHDTATAAPPADPAHIAKKRADYAKLLGELETIQQKMQGGSLTQQEGEAAEQKAQEAEQLQREIAQYDRISGLAAKGRELDNDPILPQGKGAGEFAAANVVGYLSLGQIFTSSPEFKAYIAGRMPKEAGSGTVAVKGLFGRDRFIPLTQENYKEMLARFEGKAIPTIGAGVIEPQRIGEVVRDAEMRQDFLRNLLNVQPTTAASVSYLTLTRPAAHAAAPTAQSALKPETALTLGTATAPVRTIPVHIPVTEQQIQDIPQIEGIIDTELRYELALEEDEQVAWGDGTGENFLGIFLTPGVSAGRIVADDTLLDKIRRAITDVRVARNMPNGIAIHPYDNEALQLLKGTDSRYVWVVVTQGGERTIWGLDVVETVAMQEPGAYATPERRILVGDFVRGATLWDRQEATVRVGYINDQFVRNQRTILAEERAAFGVKRFTAFRYVVSQARVA